MPELDDYSGPYKPDLKWEDFSKEFLVKLMHTWQVAHLSLSAFFHDELHKRLGSQAADEVELAVWSRVAEHTYPKYAAVANIQLNTVVDSMKLLDMGPDGRVGTGLIQGNIEIINENHVVGTTTRCRILEALEATDPERIKWFCHVVEPQVTQMCLNNPKIKVTHTKRPPRSSPDEIPCQFEFKIEE